MAEPGSANSTIRFGVFEVDPRSGEVRKSGIRIHVQEQPFQVLLALLEHPGEVVSREDLRQRIWPTESFGDFDHAVNVAVAKLRTALGDSADTPRYVETLPRRGYRFIFPLTASRTAADGGAGDRNTSASFTILEKVAPAVANLPESTPPDIQPGTNMRRHAALWSVVLLVAAALAMAFWFWPRRSEPSSGPRNGDLQIRKLTNHGNVAHVAISPDGRYLAYALREKEGLGLWTRAVDSQSEVRILPASPAGFPAIEFSPDGTRIYFAQATEPSAFDRNLYSIPILGGSPRLLIKGVDSPIQFSPDGKQILFIRKHLDRNLSEVLVANADGTSERVLATFAKAGGEWQPGGSWSPDGKTVAVSKVPWNAEFQPSLEAISVADGSVRTIFTSDQVIGRPLWMPKGDEILAVLQNGEGRDQIYSIPYPRGAPRLLTHDLEDYHEFIDATRDRKTLVAIAWTEINNIFVQDNKGPSEPRQITFGQQNLDEVAVAPNGKLVVHESENPASELWMTDPDGSHPVAFTNYRNTIFPSRCGKFVLFVSKQAKDELIRVDTDGLNAKVLTSGSIWSPVCSGDGKEIFYADWSVRPQKILRVSIDGGPVTQITEVTNGILVGTLSVSPDGRFLTYPRQESGAKAELVVQPVNGGPITKRFPGVMAHVRWTPDGRGIFHFDVRDYVVQLVEQPLRGGPFRAITNFSSGRIGGYDWSLDGKHLFLSHGNVSSDVVLISNIR